MARKNSSKAVEAEAEAELEVKVDVYCLKQGKAVTSKRGILSDGDEVTARDLAGGGEAMTAFIESGHIILKA